ncbi:SARP family transcriptional regulator [Streptomyces camponoticapitis]|uniref:SARP family transcriptional regulator n=1 Tax=Streptomyces camponoticapitis TaxID=1616125 RepID=A0ABQ2EX00_9ACTN|nr:BTAD domain-containing putative transcriptional regulator [Streptomyces camponoticapitis]GGK29968.1 SARP family transcriptional regulator [Streptomyces camponoticapitis]
MSVRFEVLGPLRAYQDDRPVGLGSVKQRLLLATLLAKADELVTSEQLIDVLWSHEPPASAASNLRSYARGLRTVLHSDSWDGLPPTRGGYILRLLPGQLDLEVFDRAITRAQAAAADGDSVVAKAEWTRALSLRRGSPLAGLPHHSPLAEWVARIEERYLAAEEDYGELLLGAENWMDVVHRMRQLLDRAPLRERAWCQLLTGLYEMGNTTDALAAFRQARKIFVTETGLEPGPRLAQLHDNILNRRPLAARREEIRPNESQRKFPHTHVIPRQLPPLTHVFVGRRKEIAQLDARLDSSPQGAELTAITVVCGMAGVGKTTLALQWAHQMSASFPDGQLYVNLRGYDKDSKLSPFEVLRDFLDALGVAQTRIPASLEGRTALFRSLLASRRILLLLDNAGDAEQVRPLLPGAGRIAVVVTSRDQLHGLIVSEGAHALPVPALSHDESRTMLRLRLGEKRISDDQESLDGIAKATGGLPLALSVVAARLASDSQVSLESVAADLRRSQNRLDALAVGDVRGAFGWSYRSLSPDAARAFRLLGLHPGPEVGEEAASALIGSPVHVVRQHMRELTSLHLLDEGFPGRYTAHDLLWGYAVELLRSSEPHDSQRAARERMYDYYLHRSHSAAVCLQPQWLTFTPHPPSSPDSYAPPSDQAEALAWFGTELDVLTRLVRQETENGYGTHAWQLAWALTAFLAPKGLWQIQFTVQRLALSAAERSESMTGQATAHRLLGRAMTRLGMFAEADDHLKHAQLRYEQARDVRGAAQSLHNRTEVSFVTGDLQAALVHAREALRLHRLAGHAPGEARTLNAIGWVSATTGNFTQAVDSCEQALEIQRQINDVNGQAATLDTLGYAFHGLGRWDEAVSSYRQSVALFRGSADRYHEAETCVRLGETLEEMGESLAAVAEWLVAAEIFDELQDPAAEDVRRHLARVDGASEAPGQRFDVLR